MTNVLIRGLSEAAVEHIDTEAAVAGLSRNGFLRRRLEQDVSSASPAKVRAGDWSRSAAAFEDLGDPDVMDAAWWWRADWAASLRGSVCQHACMLHAAYVES